MSAVLGVDVGTSSTKAVLVTFDGSVAASAVREHAVSRPRPRWAELDAAVWWEDYPGTRSLAHELARAQTVEASPS